MRHPKSKKKPDGKFVSIEHFKNPLNKQDWATPPAMVRLIARMLGLKGDAFDLDVCALPATAKAKRFFTPDDNGLVAPWFGACWCNPPFKIEQVRNWASKVYCELSENRALLSTFLCPPKSDQDWWHMLHGTGLVTHQIDCRGRIAFLDEFGHPGTGQSEPTSCLVLTAGAKCFAPVRGWVEHLDDIDAWRGGWFGSTVDHTIYTRARLL